MLIINNNASSFLKLNTINSGYEYDDATNTVIVQPKELFSVADFEGNTYEIDLRDKPVYESDSIFLELNLYLDEDISLEINSVSTTIPFSLTEQTLGTLKYKYYKLRGYSNYCLLLKNTSTLTKTITIKEAYLKFNGNCVSSTKSQILGKTTVISSKYNASSQPYTEDMSSSLDTLLRNTDVLPYTRTLSNHTYTLRGTL